MMQRVRPRVVVSSPLRSEGSLAVRSGRDPHTSCFAKSEIAGNEIEHTISRPEDDQRITSTISALQLSSEPRTSTARFEEALTSSSSFDGASFFCNEQHARINLLTVSYRLYCELKAAAEEKLDRAIATLPADSRQRAPCRAKRELLAVHITAKPMNTSQRKQCSKFSNALIAAGALDVAPDAFEAWVQQNDLSACALQVKELRSRQHQLEAEKPAFAKASVDLPQGTIEVKICVRSEGKPFTKVMSLSLQHEQVHTAADIILNDKQLSFSERLLNLAVALTPSA